MNQNAQPRDDRGPNTTYRGARAITRLFELGLTVPMLAEPVAFAQAWMAAETDNDPRMARGILGWSKGTRAFRDRAAGWTKVVKQGFEFTLSPDGRHGVVVASGDASTGTDLTPTTRSLKGPMMKIAVRRNQSSFDQIASDFPPETERWPDAMWVLMFFADQHAEQIRIELSRPSGITDDGRIREWDERIIIDAIPYESAAMNLDPNGPPDYSAHDDDDDGADDFDVPPRAS